jgi:hypothetical protein
MSYIYTVIYVNNEIEKTSTSIRTPMVLQYPGVQVLLETATTGTF